MSTDDVDGVGYARPRLSAADLVAFEELPTSVLSDALDELGIPGALPGVLPQRCDQGPVAGRAMTARFQRMDGDDAAYRYGGGVGRPLEQVLTTMRRGDFVVLDLGGTATASAWGGLASKIALKRGVKGTVIYGTCRDVAEIRASGYAVWATGTFPRRSRNEFTFGSVQEPVTIGTVVVRPDDIIVADATGVVCVPHDRSAEVLAVAQKIAAVERQLLAQIEEEHVLDWDGV